MQDMHRPREPEVDNRSDQEDLRRLSHSVKRSATHLDHRTVRLRVDMKGNPRDRAPSECRKDERWDSPKDRWKDRTLGSRCSEGTKEGQMEILNPSRSVRLRDSHYRVERSGQKQHVRNAPAGAKLYLIVTYLGS